MTDSELRRTHSATVAVRAVKTIWQGLLAAVTLTIFGVIEGAGWASAGIFALILLAALVGAGAGWLKWHFFRYGIVGSDLLITEGWLVRKRRAIPLARVQGVGVRADLFMRLFGVAQVIVQTAGGTGSGDAEASIGEVTLAEAERLRYTLLHGKTVEQGAARAAYAAGADGVTATTPAAPDVTGRMSDLRGLFGGEEQARREPSFEYRISVGRLALAAITSRTVLVISMATLGVASQVLDFAGPKTLDAAGSAIERLGLLAIVVTTAVVLTTIGFVAIAVSVSRDFGFVTRRVGRRIETEAGLFERRMTGMSVTRIQTVTIDETPLQRLLGWASIQMASAGSGDENRGSAGASSIVPIARRLEVYRVLHDLAPEVARFPKLAPLPPRAVRFYLTVPTLTSVAVFATAALAVSLVDDILGWWVVAAGCVALALVYVWRMLAWRNAAFGADSASLAIAQGILGRRRTRLGKSRIQALTMRQNPFQRRAGLATVVVAGVSGSSGAHYRISHLDVSDAERLIDWYSSRPDSSPSRGSTSPGNV
jgi:putative membrane protein